MTIAGRLLGDRWRGARGWALGTVAGVATVVALWPSVRGNLDIERVVQDLPASVRVLIGSQPDIPLGSAAGYLQARLFSTILPILLLIYGIGLGAAAVGAAEEDGTLQLVVTAPVSRTRVAAERLGASLLLLVGLAGLALLTTVLLGLAVGVFDELSVGRVALATAGVTALAVLHAMETEDIVCAVPQLVPPPPPDWIVQAYVAGEPSTLPAASIARTRNVCAATLRPEYAFGVVQAA